MEKQFKVVRVDRTGSSTVTIEAVKEMAKVNIEFSGTERQPWLLFLNLSRPALARRGEKGKQ